MSRHPLLGWPCFCFLLLCKHVVLLENGPESVVNSKQGDKQSTSLARNIIEIVEHFLKLSCRRIRVFLQVVYGKKVPDLVMRERSRKINGNAHRAVNAFVGTIGFPFLVFELGPLPVLEVAV